MADNSHMNSSEMAAAAKMCLNGAGDPAEFYKSLDDDEKQSFASMLWRQVEPGISHDPLGKGITLPGLPIPMSLEMASQILAASSAAQNEMCDVQETFDAYPYDAAVAFVKALRQTYHLSDVKAYTVQSFFGPVKIKPEWRAVQLSHIADDSIMVPIGAYNIPGIDGELTTGFGNNPRTGKSAFYVNAEVRTKDRKAILDLIALTKRIIFESSIYKGKALRLAVNGKGAIIEGREPTFIDVGGVKIEDLIFNEDVRRLLEMSLFTLIRKLAQCINVGINTSRKVLLTSSYGMGKSLTGRAMAALAVQHGWTFILVDNPKGLKDTLEFAKRFQPCVVFVEDIDRVTSDRGEDVTNDLLNTLDGVLSKTDVIISVFTTNHADRITPAVRRAGRLDTIVNIGLPDAKTKERMVRTFCGASLSQKEDIAKAISQMENFTPATIAEVVKSAKLSSIMDGRDRLSGEDVEVAAIGMRHHHEFSTGGDDVVISPKQHAGAQITALLEDSDALKEQCTSLREDIAWIKNRLS